MAPVVPGRMRYTVMHRGGRVVMTRGLAPYLGLDTVTPTLGLTGKGNRRRARKGVAVPGVQVQVELDDITRWTVSVVGSIKAFEDAYFVARPAPKLMRAWTAKGTELTPRKDS
jgi:hypothetical protein